MRISTINTWLLTIALICLSTPSWAANVIINFDVEFNSHWLYKNAQAPVPANGEKDQQFAPYKGIYSISYENQQVAGSPSYAQINLSSTKSSFSDRNASGIKALEFFGYTTEKNERGSLRITDSILKPVDHPDSNVNSTSSDQILLKILFPENVYDTPGKYLVTAEKDRSVFNISFRKFINISSPGSEIVNGESWEGEAKISSRVVATPVPASFWLMMPALFIIGKFALRTKTGLNQKVALLPREQ